MLFDEFFNLRDSAGPMSQSLSEFKEISGLDYLDMQKTNLDKNWESKFKSNIKKVKSKTKK